MSFAELTEVPGRNTNVVPEPVPVPVPVPVPAPGYFETSIPVPRVLCHGRTELTEIPGTGVNVLQNLQNFRYGWENTSGMVLYVPYRTQPCKGCLKKLHPSYLDRRCVFFSFF